MVTKGIFASAISFGTAVADWQFLSRSNLAPPRLNTTIPATEDFEPGYLFVVPLAGLPDTPIVHAYMDSGDLSVAFENYHAFRFNWTGAPVEEPAIASLRSEEGTTIHVSWYGDTETDTWRFWEVSDEYGSRSFLGESKRTSFETSLRVPGRDLGTVSAEAVDKFGTVLGSTAAARTEQEILPITAGEMAPLLNQASRIQGSPARLEADSLWDQWVLVLFGGRQGGPGCAGLLTLTRQLMTLGRRR
ncbi:hypothetical protein IMZ48_23240 [Candidatus Bathyarchaeota archaeon]|nr:hypothetical protein [Candidatus Bathyarchaeota archaeon]